MRMGWGQKPVLKLFGKAALCKWVGKVLWSAGAGGEGLQELRAVVGLWACGVGLE